MNLDVVSLRKSQREKSLINDLLAKEEHFKRWMAHPSSSILHHEAPCCEEARLWFLAYARSMEISSLSQFGIRAPTWLSQLFTWGRSEWPISWCQIVQEDTLDCGAFAALSREVFIAQGHAAYPAQALLNYNRACTDHWKDLWKNQANETKHHHGEAFPWIGDEIVYHEICLLELPNGEAKVYDSTWGNWHVPEPRVGFGSLLALRSECPRLLSWGPHTLSCGEWIDL